MTTLQIVGPNELRSWLKNAPLSETLRPLGRKRTDSDYVGDLTGMPRHLLRVVEKASEKGDMVAGNSFESIPFFSLCHGLLLPLSGLAPERVASLFGIAVPPPPAAAGREALLHTFFAKEDIGLNVEQKLACVLGDPFLSKGSGVKRDSLISLLATTGLVTKRELVDRLPAAGEVAALFADLRPKLHVDPPLTAAEVLETLALLPDEGRISKLDLLRGLYERCGKLEAYFLARLVLRRAGVGFDYQGPLVARALAKPFKASEEAVAHAITLTSAFHVARVLREEGVAGLQGIRLKPLVAVKPSLASGGEPKFPAWVERKYDGVRLMLHKSTDTLGSTLCGAYTRNRNDWLENVRGLDATIRRLPCREVILDGELHGIVADLDGAKPATVYDVQATVMGSRVPPASLRFTAFDILYLDGRDLTSLPLRERRRLLAALLAPLATAVLPIPLTLAEGQLATNQADLNRLYQHFRAQGHEGVVAKSLEGTYKLGERDSSWTKKKPEVTLDLAILGVVLAVTTKENAGKYGSYVIGARDKDGSFVDVGDVAGLDREKDAQVRAEIVEGHLLTGKRIERASASGVRPGHELRPSIVVTVRFEGVTRDADGRLSLRDPKVVTLRSDKLSDEADTVKDIEELYLQQRIG